MITVVPVTLELNGVRLEPMTLAHAPDLARAAADGDLWKINVTSVPAPGDEAAYINTALEMREAGSRLPFVVRDLSSGLIIGSTSYHDIIPATGRLEIGYTWYAKSRQRSHVNTSCKLMLMSHAFDTLGCTVVGLRTDNMNFASQAAIERLGAQRDGLIRNYSLRRDGTTRDAVLYSVLAADWLGVKANLQQKLAHHAGEMAE
jgi:RimJ/RimL family protein N-acetyltransferase